MKRVNATVWVGRASSGVVVWRTFGLTRKECRELIAEEIFTADITAVPCRLVEIPKKKRKVKK